MKSTFKIFSVFTFYFYLVLTLSFSTAYSASSATETTTTAATATQNLIKQADEFADLINNKEYTKVAFKINPLIVITMGGISQATDAITYGFKSLDSGHNSFKGIKFNEPDPIVTIQNDLVAIVPTETLIQVKQDLYKIDSFYIAWSSDKGKLWYFADGSGFNNPESLEFLFPEYNNELTIPTLKRPYKISPTQS